MRRTIYLLAVFALVLGMVAPAAAQLEENETQNETENETMNETQNQTQGQDSVRFNLTGECQLITSNDSEQPFMTCDFYTQEEDQDLFDRFREGIEGLLNLTSSDGGINRSY